MAKWPFYHLKFYPTANTLIANDKDYSILHFPIEEIQMFYIENRDIEIKRRRKKKKKKKKFRIVVSNYFIVIPISHYLFYLFLDLLLLFFFALFPDLFFDESFPVFSFKETCSRLPLLACPFANCPAISEEETIDPFWLYWPITEWFFPVDSLLPLLLPLLAVVPWELTRLQLSSLPLLPICDSDSLYRSTGIKFLEWENRDPTIGTWIYIK